MTQRFTLVMLGLALAGCDTRVLDLGQDASTSGGSRGSAGQTSTDEPLELLLDGKQLALGGNASCFRRADGVVKCWGQNDRAQLSVPTTQLCGSRPCTRQPYTVPSLRGASKVALGYRFGCALLGGMKVSCWGENTFGELGRSTHDDDQHPDPLEAGRDAALDLWLGAHHACALTEGGQVRCWGLADDGQLGLEPSQLERCQVPAELRGIAGVPSAADVACATAPTVVPAFEGAAQLALGDAFTCARFDDGRVACVGRGSAGQLGDGGSSDATFEPVTAISAGATDLSTGSHHACAIVDERVRCWGGNELGQLGVGSVAQDSCTSGDCLLAPSVLGDLPNATALALGANFSCALLQDTTVRCWGDDANGQLGNSSFAGETCTPPLGGAHDCARRPSEAYDLTGVIELRAGASHACALIPGELRCWGSSESGQASNHDDLTFPSTVYGLN